MMLMMQRGDNSYVTNKEDCFLRAGILLPPKATEEAYVEELNETEKMNQWKHSSFESTFCGKEADTCGRRGDRDSLGT